jgi:glycosyltransferase involved in cell wall biosynthesis
MAPSDNQFPAAEPSVVFDGRYIQDRYHGIGRYAYHLLRQLGEMAPGVRFSVLRDPHLPDTRFDWPALAALPNLAIHEVDATPFSAKEQLNVPGALATLKGAVYHSPYFPLPWLMPPRTKALVTVHDCIFEHDARYMPRRWARLYYRLLMAASVRRSRVVFVPSKATADDVKRFYRVPACRMVITPEAADPSFRPVSDCAELDRVRQKYNLPGRFVLAVGARRPHKNFGRLVEAMAGGGQGQLVFAGDADERFPDEAAAAARGLGDRVRFLGRVPEADLPVLYNLATVFACPSLIEGFGLPVLEAMACGTPVVCSDISVFREVAAGAATLVPPEDIPAWTSALSRILTGEELQATLRQAGIDRAAQFNWRRAALPVLSVYGKLRILIAK